jgi:phage FluMu protein Com
MDGKEIQEMTTLNLGGKVPRCPLCHEWMDRKLDLQHATFIFKCDTDKVAIRVDDPFVNRWEEANKEGIPCPRPECERPMRYFATSTGFIKAVCPKCKASMSNGGTRKEGTVETTTPEKPGVVQ